MSANLNNKALFAFLLECGDDHLILGHRLSEWCGHAPMLEEDIALANVALDCLGASKMFLEEAARVENDGRSADDLAFFREATEFRNCTLVEQPNGDFAETIVRQFFFDCYACVLLEGLSESTYQPLSDIAAKALKEARYHARHSGSWLIRLGDGTEESHQRTAAAVENMSRFTDELFSVSSATAELQETGVIPEIAELKPLWQEMVNEALGQATLMPLADQQDYVCWARDGKHTEHLGHLLSEMQITARSFPDAQW